MTITVDESYQLGKFRDNEDSLRRLKRQAGVVLDLELSYLERSGLSPTSNVLDVGCGPGIIASEVARRAPGRRVHAVDCNDVSLSETRRAFQQHDLKNADVAYWNVYDERIPGGGNFDFIYSRLVFQHLSEPVKALRNIKECLSARGRLCICDVDDRWLSVAPAVPELKSFLDRVAVAQAARGGDRHVGTKLAHYMKRAGYTDIQSEVLLVTSELIGADAFCDLVFGFKLEVLPAAELEAGRRELTAIKAGIHANAGSANLAAFFVSGRKA